MDIKNVVKFRKSSESIERKCAHLERCLSNKTSTRWRPAQSFRKGVIRSTCRRPNYCPTSRLSEHVTDGHNQVVARAARSRHGPYTCSPGASPGLNYWLLNWGPARQLCISRCWCSPQGSILNLDRLKLFLERGRERERERRIDCSRIKEGMEILIDASHRTIICGYGLNSNLRIF